MIGISISFIAISTLIAVICFLTTSNIFYAVAIFLVFTAYFFIYLFKKLKKYNLLIKRVHSCYFFINSFLFNIIYMHILVDFYK